MKLRAMLLVLTLSATAFAQNKDDPAGAQFDLGLAAMKAEKYETACPAFAESYRLDPRPGVLFTLAECESKWGKLASALSHYQAYLDAAAKMKPDELTRQKQRVDIATSQKQSLEAAVPRLTITLSSAAPPGSTVVLDAVAVEPARMGTPLPLDPGDHTVVLNMPDGTSDQKKISLSPKERRTLELGPAKAASNAPSPTTTPTTEPPPATTDEGRSSVPMIAAIGVGVLALGVGTVTGLIASGKRDTINEHCVGTKCDATGKSAGDDAKSLAMISTVGFGVAAVAVGAVIVLIVTAPSKPSRAAAISLTPFGVAGSF